MTVGRKRPNQADQLCELALHDGRLVHKPDGIYVIWTDGAGVEHRQPLRSKPFRLWLVSSFRGLFGKAPDYHAISPVLEQLEALGMDQPLSDESVSEPEPTGTEAQRDALLALAAESKPKYARDCAGQPVLILSDGRTHNLQTGGKPWLRRLYAAVHGHPPTPAAVNRALEAIIDAIPDCPRPAGPYSAIDLEPAKLAEVLMSLAGEAGYDLFRDLAGVQHITVPSGAGGWLTFQVRSPETREYLAQLLAEQRLIPSSLTAFDLAVETLAASTPVADRREVFLRVAPGPDASVFIDLADLTGRAVEVRSDGYRVVERSPVAFRRGAAMRSLPEPVSDGSLDALLPQLSQAERQLVLTWAVHCLWPYGARPLLVLFGEPGAGKTTAAYQLRSVLDPSHGGIGRPTRDEESAWVIASHSWIVVLDNLSNVPRELSDTLAALATGGAYLGRARYTDSGLSLVTAKRPVILTGLDELARAGDLASRSVFVRLPVLSEQRSEDAVWRQIDETAPALFGALLDVLSGVLRERPNVEDSSIGRMGEYGCVGQAVERVLGWEPGSFAAAYRENQASGAQAALEADPMAPALWRFVQDQAGEWTGTARELLAELRRCATDEERQHRRFPSDPARLGTALSQLTPALRSVGLNVQPDRVGRKRERVITLKLTQRAEVPAAVEQTAFGTSLDPDGGAAPTSEALRDCGRCGRAIPAGHDRCWAGFNPCALGLVPA
ncbi:MAG TPA: hypothetical protein VK009_29980 [Chloroflexota bacterium]|nr:hypothetical protein [Chloroflexota bacterium]